MIKNSNQAGFSHLIAMVLVIVVIAVAGFAGYRVMSANKTSPTATQKTVVASQPIATGPKNCGTEKLDTKDYDSSTNISVDSAAGTDSAKNTSGLSIDNTCFNDSFKSCQPATLTTIGNFTVSGYTVDDQVNYSIVKKAKTGCEVSQLFVKSTTAPPVKGKELTCAYDNSLKFDRAITAKTDFNGCTGSYIKAFGG